ncbi:MAG: TerB family tellurite resistance protein [Gammaproteobacteria bacterium]|nr:TerB family tellurite resistance protein [Gammaproteobacteria bacterium]
MLGAIKSFFDTHIFFDESTDRKVHGVKLAAASLLIEMMRMDDEIHPHEQQAMMQALQNKFALSEQETQELVELANEELKNSTDYYQFTSLINQNYEYEERVHMIELLWEVAYADRELDLEEEHLVRKVAELIHVSHPDFIAAKLKVRDRL